MRLPLQDLQDAHERTMKLNILLAIVTSISCSPIADAATDPSSADYVAAAKLLYPNLKGLVRNDRCLRIGSVIRDILVSTRWERWPEFVVVTSKGVKAPAFDHEGLARALYRAMGEQAAGKGLPAS